MLTTDVNYIEVSRFEDRGVVLHDVQRYNYTPKQINYITKVLTEKILSKADNVNQIGYGKLCTVQILQPHRFNFRKSDLLIVDDHNINP